MSGKPLRALLVEDSENDAMLLLRELKKGGYESDYLRVQTAEEMEEALEEGSWEVVLSDHDMPRFGAVAALELLRGAGHGTPFVVVSGKIGEDAEHWLRTLHPVDRERVLPEEARTDETGKPFEPGAPGVGLGQQSMRHRARELGGELVIESGPGRGMRVRYEAPLSRLVAGDVRGSIPDGGGQALPGDEGAPTA